MIIIQDLRKQLAISVFKYLNNLYPESLKTCSNRTSRVHSYNVRGASNNVFVPRPRIGGQSWNGLENELKDKINLNSCKSALPFAGDCLEEVVIELIHIMYT